MRFVVHMTFFFLKDRFCYVNRILNELNKYPYPTDLFIHTNEPFALEDLIYYSNGQLMVYCYNMTNEHPFYLTWKCRGLLKEQKDQYDAYIYIEDDILIPVSAIEYWFQNKEKVMKYGYNLGFLRIEVDSNGIEHTSDIAMSPEGVSQQLHKIVYLEDKKYILNDQNTYCASWIYDKEEFSKFVESSFYDTRNIRGYGIREKSAIGLHGKHTPWYKGTLIPLLKDNQLDPGCRIYHLPNNYLLSPFGWKIFRLDEAVKVPEEEIVVI